MQVVLVGGCAAVGALVGAWTPGRVYRLALPVGAERRRECRYCRAELPAGWRGWLRLDGRCPACHTALAGRSWAYVTATAVGFAALAWRLPTRRPAEIVLLIAWLLMTAVGVVLAGIDVAVNRLPRPVIAGAAAVLVPLVALAAVLDRDPWLLARAAAAAAAFGAVYLVLALVGPGLVGLGDVYLAALLGMLLGTGSVSSIVIGAVAPFLLNTPISAVRLALRRVQRGSHIAWGPYLVAGAVLAKVFIPL